MKFARIAAGTILAAGLALGLMHFQDAAQGQQTPSPDAGKSELAESFKGVLTIGAPIPLFEGEPKGESTCRVGDLVQFQFRYAISPPFPKGVQAYSDSPSAVPLEAIRTEGPAAILTDKPQTSTGLGVGHFSVFVKAHQPGKSKVTVEIKLTDGNVKVVPLSITVENARQ